MVLGGMMIPSARLGDFLALGRSPAAAVRAAPVVLRYLRDRLTGAPRGTLLSGGNALVAALLRSARAAGVEIVTGAAATGLVTEGGRVTGIDLRLGDRATRIVARNGVLIATGGFGASDDLTAKRFPDRRRGITHVGLAPATNTGDGLRLALAVGAALRDDAAEPCAWSPVSLVPTAGGRLVPFPHYIDRGKPGVICVDRRGRRFANEALSYHVFTPELVARADGEAWIVCDHAAFRRWGLGAAPPSRGSKGGTCGPDTSCAPRRWPSLPGAPGSTPPRSRPPSPPSTRPRGAERTPPSDAARPPTSARVLDAGGNAIPGLYAAGNDAATPFGGAYPGAGGTIGPAMVFAWRAARAMAGAGTEPT